MGSSFSCKICVVGFICGVCLTSLFLAALTSFGDFRLGGISFSAFSSGISTMESGPKDAVISRSFNSTNGKERIQNSRETSILDIDERVALLFSDWSDLLTKSINEDDQLPASSKLGRSVVPQAPHLENCKVRVKVNHRLDSRVQNESLPPWTIWKGMLDNFPLSTTHEQQMYSRRPLASEGVYPPWIAGSDEENYPLTRKAQRDIWLHQHPSNCREPSIRFLVADWERLPGFGIGAQLVGMCGLLAIAINEKRVLVTSYYNRADHDGCKETSQECRERAFELVKSKEAWEKGIVTGKDNYTSKEIWAGRIPRVWGDPWSYMQPTTDINGSLIAYHRKMDRRWWRAQAVRYLMRFPSEYTCNLMNIARHEAFGWEAAKMVLATPSTDLTEDAVEESYDIEKYVWSNHKPWIRRPLLSMHVRMGDKACEMKVVGFQEYMNLAERIRKHFPHLDSIWLSTEMQEVIDRSKLYRNWKFYYTNVTRQVGEHDYGNLLKPALVEKQAPIIPWLIS